MRLIRRILLGLFLALAACRMVVYLTYVVAVRPFPLETTPLEPKMVLLAYRVQQGLSLYPSWWDYPHVANFFGPVYFLLVGGIGRLAGATIPMLFLIGRDISIASTLLTTVLLGFWIARRYGRWAGLAGAIVSLGCASMFNVSVMVRPDTLSELLGLAGFVLSLSPGRRGAAAGVVAFLLAAFTKQTALVFLLAAMLALAAEGRKRRALEVVAATVAGSLAVILALNQLWEPHFARSLVGEGAMPWSLTAWWALFSMVSYSAPDLLLIPIMIAVVALRRQPRDVVAASLCLVLLVSSVGLSAKLGASQNYYLNLRIAEAVAVGYFWNYASGPLPRYPAIKAALFSVLMILLLLPGLIIGLFLNRQVSREYRYALLDGNAKLRSYQRFFYAAKKSKLQILTDWDMIDLYQGDRAPLGDPWLYKAMVETGRLSSAPVEARIDARHYDLILTLHDLNSPTYAEQEIRLPLSVVARIKSRYELADVAFGLYAYLPRTDAGAAGDGTKSDPATGAGAPDLARPKPR